MARIAARATTVSALLLGLCVMGGLVGGLWLVSQALTGVGPAAAVAGAAEAVRRMTSVNVWVNAVAGAIIAGSLIVLVFRSI